MLTTRKKVVRAKVAAKPVRARLAKAPALTTMEVKAPPAKRPVKSGENDLWDKSDAKFFQPYSDRLAGRKS